MQGGSKRNSSCAIADIVVQAAGYGIVWSIFWSSFAVCTVVTNGIALTATIGKKQFQTSYNYLLVSLFTSDLLAGCIVQILYAFIAANQSHPHICILKRLSLYFASTFVLSSTFSIVGLSFNLYFRIRKPRVYETISSKRKWKIFTGIAWILSILSAITPIFYPQQTPLIPILVPLLFITTIVYWRIMIRLRTSVGASPEPKKRRSSQESSGDYKQRCQKVAAVFLLSSLLLTFLPCLGVILNRSLLIKTSKVFRYFYSFTSKLPWIKNLIDPFVYLWLQKAGRSILRQRMRHVIRIVTHRRDRVDVFVEEQ